jgi:hypothetical protein
MFGMINYTESPASSYLAQVNGTYGAPQQIVGQAIINQTNVNQVPQCCIPSVSSI